MANKLNDMIGKRYGNLTVIKRVSNDKQGAARFLCDCDCGNEKVVRGYDLRRGDTKSCGCLLGQNALNLVGERFVKWTVISRVENTDTGQSRWLCECDCGTCKEVLGNNLVQDRSKSCGCVTVQKTIERSTKHGFAKRNEKHPLYRTWLNMKDRCNNPNNKRWKHYGGRRITVCERWNDFTKFIEDIGEKPHGATLD